MNMSKFELIQLPYSANALEPVISQQTIEIHHGKHLAAYVNNLNSLLPGSEWEEIPLVEIVKQATGGVANNAGQILNHEMYFAQFREARKENIPENELLEAIDETFGSFSMFQEQFEKAGTTLFGSGWVWLSAKDDGSLVITQETNASNPVQHGLRPLLTFDVWEHAYYLDYQNRRADYLHALWDIVDWEVVEQRYLLN